MRSRIVLAVVVALALLLPPSVGATGSNDQQLVEAAAERDGRTVRALLSDGVDVNSSRADGTTALHWAVHRDDLELVELLVQARRRRGREHR